MKTLTISEATRDLATVLKQVVAGEDIGIRSDNTIVALRPLPFTNGKAETEQLLPQEALRRLQQDAQLTQVQVQDFLNEVRAERLAAESRRDA